jgi:hypothetical protein
MIDGGIRGKHSPLFFMETAPLLLQFLPQDKLEQSAPVSYESTEIKATGMSEPILYLHLIKEQVPKNPSTTFT